MSVQNASREPATASDAASWAAWHGGAWVNLADPTESWIADWQNSNSSYYLAQSYTVIGSDGVVYYRKEGANGSTLSELKAAVTAAP